MENTFNKKYNIIIHTLVKDEDHILNEWIIHNINIGIEHIFIYDDQSKISVKKVISILPTYYKSKVTIFKIEKNINFYDNNQFIHSIYYDQSLYPEEKNIKQFYFQNYFLKKYKKISKWCFFCDVDEFIYLKDNITLNDILNTYESYEIIFFPWLVYGSSFHIDQPKGLVIDNFRYHDNKYFHLGKSICKMEFIEIINDVHFINNSNKIFILDGNTKLFDLPVHINHYQINSIKTYINRKLRKEIGWKDGNMRVPNDIFKFMLCLINTKNIR